MTDRKVTHDTFFLERIYPATPSKVFHALSDPVAKKAWFSWPEDMKVEASMDFRVGGREVNAGGPPGGPIHRFEAIYMDIVPDQRVIYTYAMYLDDIRVSVSVTTFELSAVNEGTLLKFTEHGAFLDGFDDPAGRQRGTEELLSGLGKAVA